MLSYAESFSDLCSKYYLHFTGEGTGIVTQGLTLKDLGACVQFQQEGFREHSKDMGLCPHARG